MTFLSSLAYWDNPWKMSFRGVILSLTGWEQRICSCPHSLMPSWVLHKHCKSLHLSLPNHTYPQQYLKKSRYSCIPLLLPPALRAQPMGCLDPSAASPHQVLTPDRSKRQTLSWPRWWQVTSPLLHPTLTRCLKSKPEQGSVAASYKTDAPLSKLQQDPTPGMVFWRCFFFCLQFKVCMHVFVCVHTQRCRY